MGRFPDAAEFIANLVRELEGSLDMAKRNQKKRKGHRPTRKGKKRS